MEIRTILWPTDFSEASQHAFDHAAAIARWYSARVVALHAFSPLFAEVPALAGADEDEIDFDTAAGQRQLLRLDLGARASAVDLEVDAIQAPPAATIVEYAERHDVDLIVMGTHGAGGFEHLILGSVTEKVLRKARCPVLTVPPRAQATSSLPFKRIVCPTDFSASSLAALEIALSFAREGDASLTLLHVIDDPGENELFVARPYDVHQHAALRKQHVMDHLGRLLPDPEPACAAKRIVESGKPYQEILRVARDEPSDLIVMGVQGRGPLDLMMFGSTTNQVVRRATCPVLTVKR